MRIGRPAMFRGQRFSAVSVMLTQATLCNRFRHKFRQGEFSFTKKVVLYLINLRLERLRFREICGGSKTIGRWYHFSPKG